MNQAMLKKSNISHEKLVSKALLKKAELQEANALKARSVSIDTQNLINKNLCISPEKVKQLRPSFG
jgi:uncharacterized protein YjbI with pentapeptide repeats